MDNKNFPLPVARIPIRTCNGAARKSLIEPRTFIGNFSPALELTNRRIELALFLNALWFLIPCKSTVQPLYHRFSIRRCYHASHFTSPSWGSVNDGSLVCIFIDPTSRNPFSTENALARHGYHQLFLDHEFSTLRELHFFVNYIYYFKLLATCLPRLHELSTGDVPDTRKRGIIEPSYAESYQPSMIWNWVT